MSRLHVVIDKLFRAVDKKQIKRTRNIRLIPDFKNRKGGKVAYGEWAHVIGIFQTIIYQNLPEKTNNQILDIGCGAGLMGIAAEPFIFGTGSYVGIDVLKSHVDFCVNHFEPEKYEFIHFDVANQMYATEQNKTLRPWPVAANSKDLVTGLSVWTHLKEEDAKFYFSEIARVLKKGARAIISFFYLDEKYEASLPQRQDGLGRFHLTNQKNWIFDANAYGSKNWLSPKWINIPEKAIGLTKQGMAELLNASGLKMVEYYPGNWKEQPGVYFQDVLIFEK